MHARHVLPVISSLAVAFAFLLVGSQARAQTEPLPVNPPAADPAAPGAAPELTSTLLGTGRTEIRVPIVINLSKDQAGKPINVPLDIYYGVNDALTVGLTHSGGVVQPAQPYPVGAGLCFGGKENNCAKVYNNVGLDALYGILRGTLQLAGHGGIELRTIDPAALALRLGVLFQAPLAERVALIFDPRIWIGLTKRDEANNKELLDLPLAVQYWAANALRLAVRTDFGGPLDGFSDAYHGSLGLFAAYAVSPLIELFGSFDFLNLYGKGGGGDFRSLVLGANFRL